MKILILGIGNVLFGDEGFGVHFAKYLEKNYQFISPKNDIVFMDGGTLANLLMHIIAEFDEVLIIDCIEANGGKIGNVYFFEYDKMPKKISWSGSAHEIEMLQTLQMLEISGDLPKTKILGIIPKRIEPMSFEISNELLNSLKFAENTALKYIASLDFEIKKINNISITDIAKSCFKDI